MNLIQLLYAYLDTFAEVFEFTWGLSAIVEVVDDSISAIFSWSVFSLGTSKLIETSSEP